MSAINSEIQKLSPSAPISLFTLDCAPVGGSIVRFAQAVDETLPAGTEIVYGGAPFIAIAIEMTGLETSGVGALPTPTLTLENTNSVIQGLANTFGDLNKCEVRRIRTFKRFLDGQPEADPTAFHGPDVFRIERKASDTPSEIVWELSAAIDQEGRMLPARPLIRDTCLWRYRSFDEATGQFDYSKAVCPYAGDQYWDDLDQPTTDPAQDVPSRSKNCCRLRFGEGQPWPFGGFPGLGRSVR